MIYKFKNELLELEGETNLRANSSLFGMLKDCQQAFTSTGCGLIVNQPQARWW
jgi:hypothetical protein